MGRTIDQSYFISRTIEWFRDCAGYGSPDDEGYKRLIPAKAVIGISGGKDSSVVAALCAKALGPDAVYGVMMPNGNQKDIKDSMDLIDLLGINRIPVNIGDMYEDLLHRLGAELDTEDTLYVGGSVIDDQKVTTNLPARLRMATLYAIANHINGRVIGTGNKAEILCGYFTLWGDGACDFDPIADLYVDEVIELGRQLGLPDRFILKTPNDGMSGVPDEEKLGFKYSDVKVAWEKPYGVALEELGKEKLDMVLHRIKSTHFKQNLTHIPHIEFPPKFN